ncbi:thioredoxin family protein [Phenylobacterium sp.]|uniref:DUF1223 domain-containing protein n=1 Tax=Phenylobacterium sp. TaxID=1871053 RepID=UPI002730BF9D|nr:DUF1223 domain-containing protein [Phenylobacterium sp.]MDP2213945.1 DUF1223 domain-containing protein [Phenylobacterium sp.]
MIRALLAALCLLTVPAVAAAAKPPVVVEFYTAQGCAACAEANTFVNSLAERPGVVALTFAVDYWDYLGWADTFAQPAFAERQKAYLAPLSLREPYTPQLVINGASEASGVEPEKVEDLLDDAARSQGPAPDIQFIGPRRVDVGSGPAPRGGAEVWLVRYDPKPRQVVVRRGENRGQTLEQRNVVREIVRLGQWRGRPTAYAAPEPTEEGLETLLIVQAPEGGRILAAKAKTTLMARPQTAAR